LFERTGEFGKKLSGGEQQRIAIARALLKRPDMLVVDEGTRSVDPVSERLIHKALEAVSPGATRIFVAHRLATVADADKIFVMKEGSVVATGTHEELLASSELYQDLVNTQLLKV
jgi:ABC-type multidrug transport system fused ATPase/permease subunit